MTKQNFVQWLVARGLMPSDNVRERPALAEAGLGVIAKDEAVRLATDHAIDGVEIGFVVLASPYRVCCGSRHGIVIAHVDADLVVVDGVTGQVSLHDAAQVGHRMCSAAASGAQFLDALAAFYDGWMAGLRGRTLIDQCAVASGLPDAESFYGVLVGD